ncbi:hypothetical protein BGZ95_003866 [Linnemannia exigua]|uniref:Uncharacterized protein n=1 Tax=Linnemannia exigua TaxID=604196 RepID=A0AAD4DI19_9FUNG|nr:hypothetical protein BGZ95_003866 [Linnemannia exigua]
MLKASVASCYQSVVSVSPSAPLISKISVQAQPASHSNNTKLPPSPILLVTTTSATTPSTSATPARLPDLSVKTLRPTAVPLLTTTKLEVQAPAPTSVPVKVPASLSLLSTWSAIEATSVEAFFGTNDYETCPSRKTTSETPPAIASSTITKLSAEPTAESIAESIAAPITESVTDPTAEPVVEPTSESTPASEPVRTPATTRTSLEPAIVHSPNTSTALACVSIANATSIPVSVLSTPVVVNSNETSNTPPDLNEASPTPSPLPEKEQEQQRIPSPPQSPITSPKRDPTTNAPSRTMSNPKATNKGPLTKTEVPAVNPYQAFVAAVDPEGTIPDGRVYVGTKSHHLDRPAPSRPSAQPPKHTFAFPQSQGRPQGGAGPPQPLGQNRSQTQAQAQTQTRPAQSQAPYRAPPNMPPARNKPNVAPPNNYRGNQQSQPQSQPSQQMRPLAESRWAGKALATAAALPEGFFSTAKAGVTSPTPAPQARLQSNSSVPSLPQQKRQQPPVSEQGYSTASSQKAFSTMSTQDQPKSTNSRTPQAGSPQQHSYQQQHQQQRPQGPPTRENGRNGSHMPPSSPYQTSVTRSVRDEDFSDDDRMSVSTVRTTRPRMAMPEENPGEPRFFQYNVGDGCHMVVAMYMERDASTALARFPQLARVRNDSSSGVKSVDQVTEIFRSAVIEEKSNLTG